MLVTLNSKQIVDEIVKDTVKDNDPHDAVQISPEMVLAARPKSVAPALAPEIASRSEPKIFEPKISEPKISEPKIFEPKISEPKIFEPKISEPKIAPEPRISAISETQATAPSVDTAVRVAASDLHGRQKRSSVGKWLRGAFVTILFAGGSAAATVAWEKHGDTARQMFAEWMPALTSLTSPTSQATPVAVEQAAAAPVAQATTDQTADQTADPSATPPAAQDVAAAPDSAQSMQSMQSMTRDLAAMAQQIEQLKANIAQLKAGQEQMAREMAKTPAPKPVVEAKPADPRARVSALPPRPPAPPVRKPKPVATQAYSPAYAPTPIAPPPSQVVAAPPPAATQAVADDDGPVVRPPMPVH